MLFAETGTERDVGSAGWDGDGDGGKEEEGEVVIEQGSCAHLRRCPAPNSNIMTSYPVRHLV